MLVAGPMKHNNVQLSYNQYLIKMGAPGPPRPSEAPGGLARLTLLTCRHECEGMGCRVRAAAKGLAARFGAGRGLPWSAQRPPRRIPAIPADPAERAVQFAHTWADRLEHHVEGRMHALDIPEHQIGASDLEHGVPWRIFFPHRAPPAGNGGPPRR